MIISLKSKLKSKFFNNTKVIENYFFMTAIQVINSLFGLLIYPYLIRVLGADSYGLYVFALSISSYFIGFVSFGFSFPAIKAVAQHKESVKKNTEIVSAIFTAKTYLVIASTILFIILLFFVPFMRTHWVIFSICYAQIIGEVLFPVWYFQAIQKMGIVTLIQLGFRLLSLPFIFIFIQSAADTWMYVCIASASVILGSISSVYVLIKNEGIRYHWVSINALKSYFKNAMPFFWSASAGTIKQESVTLIIGSFFGMRDVALYDLANKIILLPRMLTMNINAAIFPKLIEKIKAETIRKIIKYEYLIGLAVIFSIVLLGKWIILLLGGEAMQGAYPLAVILSVTVLTWLVVGSYISFVFVPQNKYYFVTQNQLVAFGTFLAFCLIGLSLYQSILVLVLALAVSGIFEIMFCKYLILKNKML